MFPGLCRISSVFDNVIASKKTSSVVAMFDVCGVLVAMFAVFCYVCGCSYVVAAICAVCCGDVTIALFYVFGVVARLCLFADVLICYACCLL